jgi:hypothetical protein
MHTIVVARAMSEKPICQTSMEGNAKRKGKRKKLNFKFQKYGDF